MEKSKFLDKVFTTAIEFLDSAGTLVDSDGHLINKNGVRSNTKLFDVIHYAIIKIDPTEIIPELSRRLNKYAPENVSIVVAPTVPNDSYFLNMQWEVLAYTLNVFFIHPDAYYLRKVPTPHVYMDINYNNKEGIYEKDEGDKLVGLITPQSAEDIKELINRIHDHYKEQVAKNKKAKEIQEVEKKHTPPKSIETKANSAKSPQLKMVSKEPASFITDVRPLLFSSLDDSDNVLNRYNKSGRRTITIELDPDVEMTDYTLTCLIALFQGSSMYFTSNERFFDTVEHEYNPKAFNDSTISAYDTYLTAIHVIRKFEVSDTQTIVYNAEQLLATLRDATVTAFGDSKQPVQCRVEVLRGEEILFSGDRVLYSDQEFKDLPLIKVYTRTINDTTINLYMCI